MIKEKQENSNQQEQHSKHLSQVWQTIKEILLSSPAPDMNFKPGSCFPGIKRNLNSLDENARNILTKVIYPENTSILNNIEEICDSGDSPEQKIASIRPYMKDLADRLGVVLDKDGEILFPI